MSSATHSNSALPCAVVTNFYIAMLLCLDNEQFLDKLTTIVFNIILYQKFQVQGQIQGGLWGLETPLHNTLGKQKE